MDGTRHKGERSLYQIILGRVGEGLGEIGGYAVAVMTAVVTINMLTRALLNIQIPGFYDITGVLGIVFYSFAIVYAAEKGVHVSVNLLLNLLPGRFRKVLFFISRAFTVGFSALLVYASGKWVSSNAGEFTADIRIPVAPFRIVFIVVFVILILRILTGKQITEGGEP